MKVRSTGIFYPAAALLLASLVLFHRSLFLPAYAIPFDLPEYHYPLAWQVASALRSWRLPLWDPFTYCGFPLHANLQAQLFYPPAWPTFAAGAVWGPDHMRTLLEWQAVLHVWLAGLLTYGLGRRVGLARAAALFAALGFELSGFFVAQAQHVGALCGAAWIPLAWGAVAALFHRATARRAATLAAALAMSFLAGFTAVTIVAFISSGILAALLWLRSPSSWRPAAAALAGAASAVALSAVQLLPSMELSALSTAFKRGSFSNDGGGAPWQAFVSLLDPNRYGVLDSVSPKFGVNPSFLYLYAGLAVALLALPGLLRARAWRFPLAAMLALHLVWLMGGQTPLGLAVYRTLPVSLRSAMYQEFAAPAFLLALCLLAGFGFEAVTARRGRLAAALLLAVAALDPAAHAWSSWFVASPAENFPAVTRDLFEESPESPKAARRAVAASTPPARLETFRGSMHWMSHAPVLGIATPNGNDPLALDRLLAVRRIYAPMEDWVRTSEARSVPSPILDLLNVRVLVTWEDDGEAPPASHFRLRQAVHGHKFYENPRALPRFFLAGRVIESRSLSSAISVLRASDFDPRRSVVVEGAKPPAQEAAFPEVTVLRYEPERVELEYDSPAPAVLVSSEAGHPGWRATIDGRETPLLLVNGAFRGAAAPAGRHRVEMRYSPRSLAWGALISLAALCGLALCLKRQG
jgi:hypothetical protein